MNNITRCNSTADREIITHVILTQFSTTWTHLLNSIYVFHSLFVENYTTYSYLRLFRNFSVRIHRVQHYSFNKFFYIIARNFIYRRLSNGSRILRTHITIATSHKSSRSQATLGVDEVILFLRSYLPSSRLMPKDIPQVPEMSVPQVVSDLESAAAVTRRVEG